MTQEFNFSNEASLDRSEIIEAQVNEVEEDLDRLNELADSKQSMRKMIEKLHSLCETLSGCK